MAKVRVRGLKELDRAFGNADKTLRKELRGKLREVAEDVAEEARSLASPRSKSGDELRGIKSFSLTGRAGVRSGAQHRGFNYPRRLEFESGGERAVLGPAVDNKEREIVSGVERVLDAVERDFGL